MKSSLLCLAALVFAGAAQPVIADPDDHGHWKHGHHKGHKYKEEYWDGHCKVERKWSKKGYYKEERKCHQPHRSAYGHPVYASPAYVTPAYVQPAVVVPRPYVLIQPPAIVIR